MAIADTVKEYWPLLAAAGAIAAGFALSGVGSKTTSGYQTVQPDNSAALKLGQTQLQAELAQEQTIGQVTGSYLNYLTASHQLDVQAAANNEALLAQEFGFSTQLSELEAQMQAATQINSQNNNTAWWGKLFDAVSNLVRAFAASSAGVPPPPSTPAPSGGDYSGGGSYPSYYPGVVA